MLKSDYFRIEIRPWNGQRTDDNTLKSDYFRIEMNIPQKM